MWDHPAYCLDQAGDSGRAIGFQVRSATAEHGIHNPDPYGQRLQQDRNYVSTGVSPHFSGGSPAIAAGGGFDRRDWNHQQWGAGPDQAGEHAFQVRQATADHGSYNLEAYGQRLQQDRNYVTAGGIPHSAGGSPDIAAGFDRRDWNNQQWGAGFGDGHGANHTGFGDGQCADHRGFGDGHGADHRGGPNIGPNNVPESRQAKRNTRGQGRRKQQDHAAGAGGGTGRQPVVQAKYINMIICKAADRGDMASVLNMVSSYHAEMTIVNLSTAMHKLARFAKDNAKWSITPGNVQFAVLHAQIRIELERQLQESASAAYQDDSSPRCWSTIAWAYGTLQIKGLDVNPVFQAIGLLALTQLQAFKPLELTNMMWGFAKMKVCDIRFFYKAASRHILASMSSYSSSNISTLVWAMVTAQQHEPDTIQQMVDEFAARLPGAQVKPVELANLMWGLATAKLHPKARVLYEIGGRALILLPEYKLQELSIMCWSFSRLHARYDRLFAGVAKHLSLSPRILQEIHPQGMANLLWSFEKQAAMGSAATEQLVGTIPMLLTRCQCLLKHFKPQEFACVFRALTRMGVRGGTVGQADTLFTSAAQVGLVLLRRLSAPQCIDLISAFSNFSQAHMGSRTEASTSFLAALMQRCFDNASELGHSGEMHFAEVSAATLPRLGVERDRLAAQLARLLLRLKPERFSAPSQKIFATLCGLPSEPEVDLAAVREVLGRIAVMVGGAPFVNAEADLAAGGSKAAERPMAHAAASAATAERPMAHGQGFDPFDGDWATGEADCGDEADLANHEAEMLRRPDLDLLMTTGDQHIPMSVAPPLSFSETQPMAPPYQQSSAVQPPISAAYVESAAPLWQHGAQYAVTEAVPARATRAGKRSPQSTTISAQQSSGKVATNRTTRIPEASSVPLHRTRIPEAAAGAHTGAGLPMQRIYQQAAAAESQQFSSAAVQEQQDHDSFWYVVKNTFIEAAGSITGDDEETQRIKSKRFQSMPSQLAGQAETLPPPPSYAAPGHRQPAPDVSSMPGCAMSGWPQQPQGGVPSAASSRVASGWPQHQPQAGHHEDVAAAATAGPGIAPPAFGRAAAGRSQPQLQGSPGKSGAVRGMAPIPEVPAQATAFAGAPHDDERLVRGQHGAMKQADLRTHLLQREGVVVKNTFIEAAHEDAIDYSLRFQSEPPGMGGQQLPPSGLPGFPEATPAASAPTAELGRGCDLFDKATPGILACDIGNVEGVSPNCVVVKNTFIDFEASEREEDGVAQAFSSRFRSEPVRPMQPMNFGAIPVPHFVDQAIHGSSQDMQATNFVEQAIHGSSQHSSSRSSLHSSQQQQEFRDMQTTKFVERAMHGSQDSSTRSSQAQNASQDSSQYSSAPMIAGGDGGCAKFGSGRITNQSCTSSSSNHSAAAAGCASSAAIHQVQASSEVLGANKHEAPPGDVMASLLDILRSPNSLATRIPKTNAQPKLAAAQAPPGKSKGLSGASGAPHDLEPTVAEPVLEAKRFGSAPSEALATKSSGGYSSEPTAKKDNNTFIQANSADSGTDFATISRHRFSSDPARPLSVEYVGGPAASAQVQALAADLAPSSSSREALAESLVRAAMQILRESAQSDTRAPGYVDEQSIAAATGLLQRCVAESNVPEALDQAPAPEASPLQHSAADPSATRSLDQVVGTVFQASNMDEPAYVLRTPLDQDTDAAKTSFRLQPLSADHFQ